jgi:hypothetical protein
VGDVLGAEGAFVKGVLEGSLHDLGAMLLEQCVQALDIAQPQAAGGA